MRCTIEKSKIAMKGPLKVILVKAQKEKRKAIEQWSPTILAPGTGFMEDNFSTDVVGGMVQAVCEQWGAADETSLACPPGTSCCAARFLTGRGPGGGEPCYRESLHLLKSMHKES